MLYLAKPSGSQLILWIRLVRLVLLGLELVCAPIIVPAVDGGEVLADGGSVASYANESKRISIHSAGQDADL